MASSLLDHFVTALNEARIPYCHWKSNYALAQAATGGYQSDNDLDLLVDRKALPCLEELLIRYQFKRATIHWGDEPQRIYHYYAFDPAQQQLLHLHLFSSVLTGESVIKSHLLPFDRMLLTAPAQIRQLKVANRSAELLLFFVRTCIKYGSWLDLLALLRNPAALQDELAWLEAGSDLDQAQALRQQFCPVLDAATFAEGLALLARPGALWSKIQLGWRVRRQLRVYAKYPRWRQLAAYGAFAWHHGRRRLTGQRRNKSLASGGAVIAFVGPEATGKSTLVAESSRWLGSAFVVRTIHAGKPPATLLTFPFNGLLPLLRKGLPNLRTNRVAGHSAAPAAAPRNINTVTALIYAIRAVAIAWDRRALLTKARRAAAQGELVICDRYPSAAIGAMDSPRLEADPHQAGFIAGVYNYLARVEAQLYRQIPPPDLVIKLSVSLATAKQRNRDRIKATKESDAYIESRHQQVRNWQRPGANYLYEVSTEKSLAATSEEVKRIIWAAL